LDQREFMGYAKLSALRHGDRERDSVHSKQLY
jgi:hypothetical protein